jgi:hypothetical protein
MASETKLLKPTRMAMLCLVGLACFAQDGANPSVRFHSANNAFEKRQALREIGKSVVSRQAPPNEPGSQMSLRSTLSQADISLLQEGLNDPNPTVVEQALLQIGKLKVVELNNNVLNVYANANSRFQGYSERIQIDVIKAIGDMGSLDNAGFLIALIDHKVQSPRIHEVLLSVEKLHATNAIRSINTLISDYTADLQQLENSMSGHLGKSDLQVTINIANKVLASLMAQ